MLRITNISIWNFALLDLFMFSDSFNVVVVFRHLQRKVDLMDDFLSEIYYVEIYDGKKHRRRELRWERSLNRTKQREWSYNQRQSNSLFGDKRRVQTFIFYGNINTNFLKKVCGKVMNFLSKGINFNSLSSERMDFLFRFFHDFCHSF